MLVGWGGNNGTTLTAGIIANREGITWKTKEGVKSPNYWGSLTQVGLVALLASLLLLLLLLRKDVVFSGK